MTRMHTFLLSMPPEMPHSAALAHIFPSLKDSSLLSIGQLCDHGCDAYFEATKVTISHKGKLMLTGKRSPGTIGKLWIFDPYLPPLEPTRSPPADNKEVVNGYVNSALNHDTIANRIAFYHASLFYPVLSTCCDSIDA
jgi:hypothetical protein